MAKNQVAGLVVGRYLAGADFEAVGFERLFGFDDPLPGQAVGLEFRHGRVEVGRRHDGRLGEVGGDILLALAQDAAFTEQGGQFCFSVEPAQGKMAGQHDIVAPEAIAHGAQEASCLVVLAGAGVVEGQQGQIRFSAGKGLHDGGEALAEFDLGVRVVVPGGLPGMGAVWAEGGDGKHGDLSVHKGYSGACRRMAMRLARLAGAGSAGNGSLAAQSLLLVC